MFRLPTLTGAVLFPAIAVAQPVQGLYFGGDVGANFADSMLSSQDTTKVTTNPGPLGLAALGWGFGNGLRAEIEGSYRSNSVSGIDTYRTNGLLEPLASSGGTAATYAVMANIEYDIPLHPFGLAVQPYIGAGMGYGWLNLNGVGGTGDGRFRLPGNNVFGPSPVAVSFGTAGALAYQAIVGASVPLHILPGLEMTAEYRYFGMARADVPVNRVALTTDTVNGAIPSNATRNGFEVQDSAVLLGVRYTFGAP